MSPSRKFMKMEVDTRVTSGMASAMDRGFFTIKMVGIMTGTGKTT